MWVSGGNKLNMQPGFIDNFLDLTIAMLPAKGILHCTNDKY